MTEPSRFVLRPRPPVRALAIASATAVVGAVLTVLWRALEWPVVVAVLGLLLLAAGVALAGAALVLARRLRTALELSDTGIRLEQRGSDRTYGWQEVKQVRVRGQRLVFATRDGRPDPTVLNPRGPEDPTFEALLADIKRRMDASRGYRS